jgi:thioesterase domain-containing protein
MDTGIGADSEVVARDLMRLPTTYAEPLNALETAICGAFSRVLRVSPIGRDDEFYDLGGDSLAGETLSMEIQAATGQVFPISSLFRHGTPAAIAQLLGGLVKPSDDKQYFIVHGRGGFTSLSPNFRSGLAPDRNVTMFELPGIRGDREPIWDIRKLAQVYVGQLMAAQPEGPIHLAAFCAGSFIALEMADILSAVGRPLDRIVLIDPLAPPEVKVRHLAELELAKNPGALTAGQYFERTGRWRDDPTKDKAAVATKQKELAEHYLQRMKDDKVPFARKNKELGFADWPRAVLVAMYHTAWPKPFEGETFIIASKERAVDFVAPDSLWRRFAPSLRVALVSDMHREILTGEIGALTAAKLEEAMATEL